MIFTRVNTRRTDRTVCPTVRETSHYSSRMFLGHTAATRRDLRAWDKANHEFWRRFRSGILDQPIDPSQPFYLDNDRLSLVCSSWFFVTNNMYQGPTAVAHGR